MIKVIEDVHVKLNPGLAMEKVAFKRMKKKKQKSLYTNRLDLNLLKKSYNWSISLYGAETWTLRKVGYKLL